MTEGPSRTATHRAGPGCIPAARSVVGQLFSLRAAMLEEGG